MVIVMKKDFDYVTLVLAGGKGTRLSVLTKEIAKPAVSFGGMFRLIDFTLSNCKHSHADVIGIVTQYCHQGLADYIGCGLPWRSRSEHAHITALPPKVKNGVREAYHGTADAIWKNADFIERYSPKNVLVLSGDHVYKMDYRKMLDAHESSGAAVTIAAITVPLSEAPHFGIMNTDKDGMITEFEEKPQYPRNNLASMGVYVFDWEILKEYLFTNSIYSKTSVDIGKDILPQMLAGGQKLNAYRFGGYWKDVGNIYSLWEANMALLSSSPSIDLHDDDWRILSPDHGTMPHLEQIHPQTNRIVNSFVAKGCTNKGTVNRSVVSSGVEIGDNATIIDSVVMPGAKIGRDAFVFKAIIGINAVVERNTVLYEVQPDGRYLDNHHGISVVGNNVNVCSSNQLQFCDVGLLQGVDYVEFLNETEAS